MNLKKLLSYFSVFEWILWLTSIAAILISFLLSGDFYPLTLITSLLGVTALIFIAKGNVVGQFLIILFSILYGIISYNFRYYGEMITYIFMSLPAAVVACISWLKNPSKKGVNEVKVDTMSAPKWIWTAILALVATVIFYFILKYFHTENLILSTVSVTTSMFAASLLFLRSPYYALAYATNDIVLIGLWTFASIESLSYIPMVVCFVAFLCNDTYGFINWKRMQKRQAEEE